MDFEIDDIVDLEETVFLLLEFGRGDGVNSPYVRESLPPPRRALQTHLQPKIPAFL